VHSRRCLEGAAAGSEIEALMLQLVIVTVVVLFAIPAFLYLVGLAARRYIGKAPSWIGLPIGSKTATNETEPGPSAKPQA
jgi:hypothetical protein